MIISVHIPKAGGTSFVHYMGTILGYENIIEDIPQAGFLRTLQGKIDNKNSEVPIPQNAKKSVRSILIRSRFGREVLRKYYYVRELQVQERGIPENIVCIHGHFPSNRYLKKYPNAHYITWLRDPVQRLISLWHYWQRDKLAGREWFHKEKPTLEKFLLDTRIRNVMSTYIGSLPLKKYSFIGITQDYNGSINRFNSFLKQQGIHIPKETSIPKKNTNPQKNDFFYKINDNIRERALAFHDKDTALFKEAIKLTKTSVKGWD